MNQLRPLLGASIEDLDSCFKRHGGFYASFKLDGFRALKYGPELLSRTLKTIPNAAVRAALSSVPSGWDGELVVGEPNGKTVFRETSSYVTRLAAAGKVCRFFVFDNYEAGGNFEQRLATIWDIPPYVVKLDQRLVTSPEDCLALERQALELGYEGLVLRHPLGRYKYGRSTLREGYLLKLKRFAHFEAEVIGFEELYSNQNEQETDERGYAKRSSHAEGKVAMGILGALVCRTVEGVEFRVGTGFSANDRATIWRGRDRYLGQFARVKSFPVGVKTAPRHPVWEGFRHPIDMSK